MERCQNRQELDIIPLDSGRGCALHPQRAVGAEDNIAMPTGKQLPKPHRPMGRSPQASDAPLLVRWGGEVSSFQGSSLCHFHQGEACWAEGEEVFLLPSDCSKTARQGLITGKTLLQCCVLPAKENRMSVLRYVPAGLGCRPS